jgi:hypothetical protein
MNDQPLSGGYPYFELPSARFLRSPLSQKKPLKFNSITKLFGRFTKMDDQKQANFLLQLMSYSTFQPDFTNMAQNLEVQNGPQCTSINQLILNTLLTHSSQRRFKKIVEINGYILEDGKHILPKDRDMATKDPEPTPSPSIASEDNAMTTAATAVVKLASSPAATRAVSAKENKATKQQKAKGARKLTKLRSTAPGKGTYIRLHHVLHANL